MTTRADEPATPGGYRADPHEAQTDLMLEGFGVLKVIVGLALLVGLIVLVPGLPHGLVFFLAAVAIAVEVVLLEAAAAWLARRRGRPDERSLSEIARDALTPAARYWFVLLFPTLRAAGLSFWPTLGIAMVVIFVVERIVERLRSWRGRHRRHQSATSMAPILDARAGPDHRPSPEIKP